VCHAVAVEPVIRPARPEVRVGPYTVERAVQLMGDLALDLEVVGVALFAPGTIVASQIGIVGLQHEDSPLLMA
jgi:hypothetical protein